MPTDKYGLAPYVFVVGGYYGGSDEFAGGHAGLGVEYRFVWNASALVDSRFTYFGTRYGHDDQNNYLSKAGIRIVF